MQLNKIEWIFFDLGDTLVDNTKTWLQMLEELRVALAVMGYEHSLEELSALFEQVSAEYASNPFTEVQRRICLNEDQHQFAERKTKWNYDLEEVIPGAHDLLAAIEDRYKLGVIANQVSGSEDRCAMMGIRQYFSVFLASAELGISKPNPRIFQLALEKANCSPDKAVMVGDRIDNDIRPAKLLGMKTIRLVRGFQRLQQPRDQWDVADITVHSLAEMQECLLNY